MLMSFRRGIAPSESWGWGVSVPPMSLCSWLPTLSLYGVVTLLVDPSVHWTFVCRAWGLHAVNRRFQDKRQEACLRGFTESRPQRGDRGAPRRWTGEGVLGRGDSRYKGTGPHRERGALKESLEQGCQYLPGSLMNVGMEEDLSVLLTLDGEIEVFLYSGK